MNISVATKTLVKFTLLLRHKRWSSAHAINQATTANVVSPLREPTGS